MTKRWIWIPVAALAAALAAACLYAMFRPVPPLPQDTPPAYTLRVLNGQVVLCRAEETAPVAYYEVYTALLPPEDTQALAEGIAVKSRAEALRLLEDYGL